jgi:hypothetical protein|nr:MAG TPA: hypothetical protein [Caudoviricetes sp.]
MATSKAKELQLRLDTIGEMIQDVKEINAIMVLSHSVRIKSSLLLTKKDILSKIQINRGGMIDKELEKYGLLEYANALMSMTEGL